MGDAGAVHGLHRAAPRGRPGPLEHAGRRTHGRGLVGLIRNAALGWVKHGAMEQGATISYFAVFSLAPLLVIAVAIAGAVFGAQQVRREVVGQFGSMVGEQGGALVGTIIDNASKPKAGGLAATLSIIMLLVGASGAFGQLKAALDQVWEVRPKPGGGVWGFLRGRFLSFGMVLVIAFLLLVSLAISALLAGVGSWAGGALPGWAGVLAALNAVVSLGVVIVLFAVILRFLPAVEIAWREVWIGAAITGVLFTLGKFLIGQYLGRAAPGSVYGAAGSMAVLLIWVYYSSLIFLFGAELTRAHAELAGKGVEPKPGRERREPPAPHG